jgi:hypothetical protein
MMPEENKTSIKKRNVNKTTFILSQFKLTACRDKNKNVMLCLTFGPRFLPQHGISKFCTIPKECPSGPPNFHVGIWQNKTFCGPIKPSQ